MDPPLVVSTPWKATELAYVYFQLYTAPLLLLACLTAMTIYRREMSSNRVYLEEEKSGKISPRGSSRSRRFRAPSSWYKSIFANNESYDSSERPNRNVVDRNRHHFRLSDLIKVVLHDLLYFTWTERSTAVVKTTAASVRQFTRLHFSKEAWISLQSRTRTEGLQSRNPDDLPSDVQVHILSYLHPKDVVTFAGTSRKCRNIVEGNGPTTAALWKTLYQRDYAWIINSWDIGREAFRRSNVRDPPFCKEFYFRFGLGYLNYVLAGQNTQERCLIGLHGDIYDISNFILNHPGSPDTLLVHAGRDASIFFDDMDHSKGARRLARDLCVIVDLSYVGSYGLRPTPHFQGDASTPKTVQSGAVCSKKERRARRRGTLQTTYDDFIMEEYRHQKAFNHRIRNNREVLYSNVFYDPFRQSWSGWYTSTKFETIFAPEAWDFSKNDACEGRIRCDVPERDENIPRTC